MRRLPFLLALALPAAAALGPRYGGELTVVVPELPASLDPSPPESPGQRLAEGLVHETLVGIGPEALPLPGLARSWTAAASGHEWTLALGETARFHDDRPVTSQDALRSLRRFLRSSSPAALAFASSLRGGTLFRGGGTDDLPGLEAPDPLHLVLRFDGTEALPLAPLSSPGAAVTSPQGAGCGPFVPTLQIPGRRMSLTAFSSHVRGRPYLDRVHLVGAASRPDGVDLAFGEGGISTLASTLVLFLEPRPPFDRKEMRQSVASSFDRADLVRNLLPGGEPTPLLLVPGILPGLESPSPSLPPPPPPPHPLQGSLTLVVSRELPRIVSQRIVAYLSALGLQVSAEASSPTEVQKAPAGARLFLFSPEVPEACLALLQLLALRPDPEAKEALAAASRETDLDRRRALLQRAEAALRDDSVLIPLASIPVSFGTRRGLHDARVDLTGRLVLEDGWLEP
jgi:ABC-type transport system substrate-binding protein